MIFLTEQQRLEAIAICERIDAINEKLQRDTVALLKTLDDLSGRNGDREIAATRKT